MAEIVVVKNVNKAWNENNEYVFLPVPLEDGTHLAALFSLSAVRAAIARARKDSRDVPPHSPWWKFWKVW